MRLNKIQNDIWKAAKMGDLKSVRFLGARMKTVDVEDEIIFIEMMS